MPWKKIPTAMGLTNVASTNCTGGLIPSGSRDCLQKRVRFSANGAHVVNSQKQEREELRE